jgi:predicted dehydrogenase
MVDVNRRKFLHGSLGAVALTAMSRGKTVSANDKVVVGVMGLGGRGTFLAERTARMPDVEVAYLCDVDSRRYSRALETVMEASGKRPKTVQDFRRMLDDREVDTIINATPDHWHGPGTVMACQAGKDVYVEKPATHNIWEGRKMVEAARKYKRVVQTGMQNRSSPYLRQAVDHIRSGKLGKIHLVKVYNMMQHSAIPETSPSPVPEGLDYDIWCGPAPKRPYRPGRWWFEHWDYSLGGIAGDAVHQIDIGRMMIGQDYPKSAHNAGSISFFTDGRQTPDTEIATYEYDGVTMVFEGTLWTPYMKKTPWDQRDIDFFPDWRFNSMKIEVFGTDKMMLFGRHGAGWQVFGTDWQVDDSGHGRQTHDEHLKNFYDCVRSREKPAADIEDGHLSTVLCHLANISFRLGNRKLTLDPGTEKFMDDDEANGLLKRTYRKPWVISEEV